MEKLKVLTVVGTRPEIIRLSRVIAALDRQVEHVLVHTGQNYDYELNQLFFEDLGIRKPDYFLEAAGATATETIGNILVRIDPVLAKENPDAFLVLGDTNSCLAALAAKRRKIPIFHMEAGNRCFDQRVPEEINRRLVDHLSDINLPYSDISREYLLQEGLPPDRTIKTGSPMFEVLNFYAPKIEASPILSELNLKPGQYLVVSAHREENVDSPELLKNLATALEDLAQKFKLPIIFSAHPRTRQRLETEQVALPKLVQIHKPFSFTQFVKLEKHALLTLSDSGTITEESSILGFRALNIRQAHERPEGMEEAAVILAGLDPKHLARAVELELSRPLGADSYLQPVADYMRPNVSEKVVRLIMSYTPYVCRVVWGSFYPFRPHSTATPRCTKEGGQKG